MHGHAIVHNINDDAVDGISFDSSFTDLNVIIMYRVIFFPSFNIK